jgi:Fur family ferric uptake transcriptional regulator
MREQIETHFGFDIVLARTEVGGYCAHCQVLRAKEMAAAASKNAQVEPTPPRNHRSH